MSTADDELVTMLRDSLERYTAEHYSFEQRRALLASPLRYGARAWADYAGFGWLALRLPEEQGGMGADAAAIGALMEVSGARLLLEPILASAVIGSGLVLKLGSAAQQALLLPALAQGSLRLAFAHDESAFGQGPAAVRCQLREGRLHGRKLAVLHGDCADRLIVSARAESGQLGLYLVDTRDAAVQRQVYPLLDGRGAATIDFQGAPVEALQSGTLSAEAALAEALDEAAVALCSETLGILRVLNTVTCDYLKLRKQFGRPIGTNQVLQHRMVEMFMLQEEVRALTAAAQRALAEAPSAARTRQISGARAYACAAARRIANEAVQMHGGIGVTEELNVSHYYRRLMVLNTLYGNRDYHLARFSAAAADAPQALAPARAA